MKKFLSKARKALGKIPKHLKRSRNVRTVKQAIADYGILILGLASVTAGVFIANVIAGFIVMGILAVIFNERVSS